MTPGGYIRSGKAAGLVKDLRLRLVNPTAKAGFLLLGRVLLLLVFAISYSQRPLYSSNQNTYFLHGLAVEGVGFLEDDWLAQTTDPFPVFSHLVKTTIHFFSAENFYFQYMLLLGVYIYGILGIAGCVSGITSSKTKYLFYFSLLTILYSGLLLPITKFPALAGFAAFVGPNGLLTSGVAGQYILGPIFQPSTFGVLLILSMYAFLRDRPFVAVFCLILSAVFHSSYLLSAAILTGTYMAVIFKEEKNLHKVILMGIFALILILPILFYTYQNFSPITSRITYQAQRILVEYRIPHHADPGVWFDGSALFQIALILFSIYLVRRTRLFPLLLLPFLSATVLTLIQVFTGNKSLALLFPWRLSVFLVPVASSIILAMLLSRIFHTFRRSLAEHKKLLQSVALLIIVILGYLGAHRTTTLLHTPRIGVTPSVEYIASVFQPGDLYLVPPEEESIRMAAGVPILVDFKSHPYKDSEVLEWFNRLTLANEFYAAGKETACERLENISAEYPITHVVVRNDSLLSDCGNTLELHREVDFVIYEVYSSELGQ